MYVRIYIRGEAETEKMGEQKQANYAHAIMDTAVGELGGQWPPPAFPFPTPLYMYMYFVFLYACVFI